MDVGGAGNVGVLDDPVGELDDRGRFLVLEIRDADARGGAVGAVSVADDIGDGADVDVLGAGGGGFGVLEKFLQQGFEERGRDDADLLDRHFRRLGERLPLGVVERVGHQHCDGVRAHPLVRENALAADDCVTGDLDQLVVDLDFLDFGDKGKLGELRDKAGGVLRVRHELRIDHPVNHGRGVFGDLLEEIEVLLGELALGAGGHLLVQDLNRAERDRGLERNGEHRPDLEAGGLRHRLHERYLALRVAEKDRLP